MSDVICTRCDNSGLLDFDWYCDCIVGKMKLRESEQKAEAWSRASLEKAYKKTVEKITVNVYESELHKEMIEDLLTENKSTGIRRLKEGDWVEFPFLAPKLNNEKINVVGYITRISPHECTMQTVGLRKIGAFDHQARRYINEIKPLGTDIQKDLDILIDLALQTKDKEWFKQLTRGME